MTNETRDRIRRSLTAKVAQDMTRIAQIQADMDRQPVSFSYLCEKTYPLSGGDVSVVAIESDVVYPRELGGE